MSDNNKLPKQAEPQEFELVELLFREYVSSHIARPDIEYSFQARFQSFIDQIPSYLHSVGKTGFFTNFFFGSFASLLDTQLAGKLGIQKLHFNFDSADHLRIVAETNDKTHVFIFTENKQNKKQKKNKDIGFTKDEWKTIKGTEYTEDDNKKLEISIIQINKSSSRINVELEKQDIQDGVSSTRPYNKLAHQSLDNNTQYMDLKHGISKSHEQSYDQSVYQETFIRNKRSDEKIGAYQVIKMSQDGNSLFWAFTISYLFPGIRDRDVFSNRFKQLFGESEATESGIAEYMTIFNTDGMSAVLHNAQFQYLVNSVLRNQLVSYIAYTTNNITPEAFNDIKKHIALERYNTDRVLTDVEWQQYLNDLRQDGKGGGKYALRVLSMICHVSVFIMQRSTGDLTEIISQGDHQPRIILLADRDHYDALINSIVYEQLVHTLTEEFAVVHMDDVSGQGSNVPVQQKGEHIAKDMMRFDLPENNYCLFDAVALAYLMPVYQEDNEYKNRFQKLFGTDNTELSKEFWWHIQQYYFDQYKSTNEKDSIILKRLVPPLAMRVITYIQSQPEKFMTQDKGLEKLKEYLGHVVKGQKWPDDTIVQALSAMLDISITIYDQDGFKQKTHGHDNNIEITLSETLLSQEYHNYYRFYLNTQYVHDHVRNPKGNNELHQLLSNSDLDDNQIITSITSILSSNQNLINQMNDRHETPLMRYIITHQQNINPTIIRTLISDFNADVNIEDLRNRVPLGMLLDSYGVSTDSTLLSVVMRYTTYDSFMKCERPSQMNVLYRIINDPNKFDLLTLKSFLVGLRTAPTSDKHIIRASDFFNLLANLYDVEAIDYMIEEVIEPNYIDVSDHSTSTSTVDDQSGNISKLLRKAINKRNYPLITRLLMYGIDIAPLCFTKNQNCMDIIQSDPVMKAIFDKEFAQFEKQIVILDIMINISDLQLPLEYTDSTSGLLHISSLIMKFHDLMNNFQYNNAIILQRQNLDNFLELASLASDQYSVQQLEQVWQYIKANVPDYQPFDEVTRLNNRFTRDPINNAILGHKTNFIKFWLQHQDMSKISSIRINKLGMTVVNAIAQSYNRDQELQQIIQIMHLTDDDILSSRDLLSCDSLYHAIIAGNTAFVKFWISIKGPLNNIDRFGNTMWHALAMSEVHKIENDKYEFSAIADTTIRDKIKSLHPDIEEYNAIYSALTKYMETLPESEHPDINCLNFDGNSLLHTAVLFDNPVLINLVFADYPHQINWAQANKEGDTIAHILMDRFLAEDSFYDPHSFDLVKSVYNNDWESNISHKNNLGLTPIEYFTKTLQATPYTYIASEIGDSAVEILIDENLISGDVSGDVSAALVQQIQSQRFDVSSQMLEKHDNDLCITIKFLLFFLVSDQPNEHGDYFIHAVMRQNRADITKKHVLYFLAQQPELMNKALLQVNHLGQYPTHVGIVDGDIDSFSTLIKYHDDGFETLQLIQTTNKIGTKPLLPSLTEKQIIELTAVENVSLLDYIIILKQHQMLKPLLDAAITHDTILKTRYYSDVIAACNKLKLISDAKVPGLIQDSNLPEIPPVYIEALKSPDTPKLSTELLESYGLPVALIRIFRNHAAKYLSSPLVKSMKIADLQELSTICQKISSDKDNFHGKTAILLTAFGHAVAIIIIADTESKLHVYYQDSQETEPEDGISDHIYTRIMQDLNIGMENIHALNLIQQQPNQLNCALWSMLNLYLLDKVLEQHQVQAQLPRAQRLVRLLLWQPKPVRISYSTSILQEMSHLLQENQHKIRAAILNLERLAECKLQLIRPKRSTESEECSILKKKLTHEESIDVPRNSNLLLSHEALEHLTKGFTDIGVKFNLSTHDTTLTQKVDMKQVLYSHYIYLYLIKNNQNDQLDKWLNSVKYRAELTNTIRSIREDGIVAEHAEHINDLFQEYSEWDIFTEIKYPRLDDVKRSGLLFHNGVQSLLVSYDLDQDNYRLYSPDFMHNNFIYTKSNLAFNQLERFVQEMFLCFSGSSLYTAFTLSEQLPKKFIQSFRIEDFLNNKAWMPDYLYVQTQEAAVLEGLPLDKIIEFFTIDGHSIEIMDLYNDEFIRNNKERIKYKIELLHKIIASLDYIQVSALISIIKNYEIGIDNTYIATLSEEDKIMFLRYSDKVSQLIKSSEAITLQQLSELSYDTFGEELDKHSKELGGVRGHKIISTIKEYFSDDINLKFIKSIGGNSIFFLPDIIRAHNTGNIDPLLSMSGMTAGDMLWNQLLEELYKKLPNAKVALLKKISSGAIFNALLINNMIELKHQLSTTDPDSRMSEALKGELYQCEAMIGLTLLRLTASLELTPIWVAVVITGIRSQGHMIAVQNDLKLNWWDEFKIGLGFKQEFLQHLITEEHLFKINLAIFNHMVENNMHGLFYIVKVPDLDHQKWITVDKKAVPQDILPKLTDINYLEEFVLYKSKLFLYGNYKYIINYNDNLHVINSYYQQAFYYAHTSTSNIKFDSYTSIEHKRPSPMEKVFIQSIKYDNITWKRIPPDPDFGLSVLWRRYYENYNPIYDFPDKYPMLMSTGYTAVYKPQSIANSNTLQEYIYVLFDPREGDMTLHFTKKGLAIINKQYSNGRNNSKYYVMVNIQNKPYPQSIVFNYTADHKKFNLEDQTKKIISQYSINDDDMMSYKVQDNAAQSILVFTNNNGGNTNRCHTLSGIDNNIIVINNFEHHCNDLMSSAQSHNYISFKDKKILNIYFNNNYLIADSNLTFTSETVYLDKVQGQSGRSQIICTNSTRSAHVGLIGNIIISDDNTKFTVVGIMPFSSNYSMTRVESDHYMIELNSKSLLTLSVKKYLQKSSIVVLVRQENNLLYNWTSTTIQETLSLQGFDDKSYLKRYVLHISDDITFLSVQDQYITITLNDSLNLAHYIINYYIKQIVQNSDLKGSVQDEQELQDTLSYCTNNAITLQNQGLGPQAINALINALEISQCNINIIDLSYNNISDHFPLLLQELESVQGLKILQFIKSNIGSDEAILLWRKLPFMHLSTIDLSYNNIDKKLLDYLSNYTKCPILSPITIDISENKLSTEQEQLLSNKNVCKNINVIYGMHWLGGPSSEDSINNKGLLHKRSIHTTKATEYDNQYNNGDILYATSGAASSEPIGYQLMQYLGGAIYSIYNTIVSTVHNQHVSNASLSSKNTLNASIDQLHATESNIIEDTSLVPNILQEWISDDTTSTNTTIRPVINLNDLLISANYFIRMLLNSSITASELMLNHHVVIQENENDYNHVFEYVDSNLYFSKHSRIPSCNRETSEVKARAERSISNADYAYSHPVGISYSDGQDVNNDTTILNNYSDNTLSQTTNGCSSLRPFGSTIVNLIRATLSKIFMPIKYYYAPIPNQDNLKLDYNSHNGSTQGTNTFDINGNLMLGQILAYKLCGKNPLCQNTHYLSPTQERNIILNQISSEVLSMCNDFINDTNTFDYNDYYDNAPSWYQDLW